MLIVEYVNYLVEYVNFFSSKGLIKKYQTLKEHTNNIAFIFWKSFFYTKNILLKNFPYFVILVNNLKFHK